MGNDDDLALIAQKNEENKTCWSRGLFNEWYFYIIHIFTFKYRFSRHTPPESKILIHRNG